MRRIRVLAVGLLFLALVGCSNAPIAGFLDNCFPSRAKMPQDKGPGVDVRPNPTPDPIKPNPNPNPIPPPDNLVP